MKRDEGFPPVPSQVFSHLGPLPVRTDDLGGDFGFTEFKERSVTLAPGQTPASAWQTYWHEAVHVALWDGGVKLDEEVEERVCDVIGTYLSAAVRSGFLKVTNEDPQEPERQ